MTEPEVRELLDKLPEDVIFVMVRDDVGQPPCTMHAWSWKWILRCSGEPHAVSVSINNLNDAAEALVDLAKAFGEQTKESGVN